MLDLRPSLYVVGLMLVLLGGLMLIPAFCDWVEGKGNEGAFLASAFLSTATGVMLALTTRNRISVGFELRQAYVLTTLAWAIVPLFGALPFMLGAPGLDLTDAYFEASSGITTTGSTVIVGLDALPVGTNLWRGMLNCIGGLGIAFVAMIFLPVMRVGGMQFFKVQGYDTLGKLLPRASDIALSLLAVYAGLTVACIATYSAIGMERLDAVVMGMATIATGGFAATDISFSKYPGAAEYAGTIFMLLGAMPYLRYVQLVAGSGGSLTRDLQVRALLSWAASAVAIVVVWRLATTDADFWPTLRTGLFNVTSVFTGTGFFSGDFLNWGGFGLVVLLLAGLIGGCSGSSSGALSVFRVQVMLAAIGAQVRQIRSPNRVVPVKYDGRTVDAGTMDALILYVTGYLVMIGALSVALTLVGVDAKSALFGVWASIGNIGYGIGPLVEPTGTFRDFPDAGKWVLIFAMLVGRLQMLALFMVVLPRFWRA
jgi:trk system potassium uptake protein TrkH